MIAARLSAPRHTPETMRQAMAAAKGCTSGRARQRLWRGPVAMADEAGLVPPSGGRSDEPIVQLIAFVLAVAAIWACWPLVRLEIPAGDRFAMIDLVREHWDHRHSLEPWLDQRWAWLAARSYHLWFALAALPGVTAVGLVQAFDRRTASPFLVAPAGWLAGAGLGYLLYRSFCADSWPLAVMMPATFAFLGGVVAARLAAPSRKVTLLRGTRLRAFTGGRGGRLRARLTGGVTLAGLPLSREDETMHVAVIGATGSGKSTALRALMADALRRGDRQVVADPEGAAMSAFFAAGDILLNPFDRRCARWDLLAEIERPSDYAFLAQSLLPHLGVGEHDQWITYAQQLLAAALENWVNARLGSSSEFITTLATATIDELKALCADTPAARYFEKGGERMLASILGTLAPAIGHLRLIARSGRRAVLDPAVDPQLERLAVDALRRQPDSGVARAGVVLDEHRHSRDAVAAAVARAAHLVPRR